MPISRSRDLSGKCAVVTAAAQGIGRAIAERLHANGANVFATDLDISPLSDFGGTAMPLDATDNDAVCTFFDTVPRVDVLVHAVGYVHQGTIEECSPEDWARSMSISLDSAFFVIGAALPK